jgi:hypothetical protein
MQPRLSATLLTQDHRKVAFPWLQPFLAWWDGRLSFNGAPPLVARAGEGVITPSQIRYVGYYNEILQGTPFVLFPTSSSSSLSSLSLYLVGVALPADVGECGGIRWWWVVLH